MDPLPLAVVGWLYTVVCGAALLFGAWLVIGLHLAGEAQRKHLAARVLDDTILFGVWILGFAGGIGVLLGKSWSFGMLELFCWTLMVLVVLSAWTRWRAAPPPRSSLLLSLVLFIVPIYAVCIATLYTLRSDAARAALAGSA